MEMETAYDPYNGQPHSLLTMADSRIWLLRLFTIWIAGDANGDGKVNILDASVVGLKWSTADPCADLNNDARVNIIDAASSVWTGANPHKNKKKSWIDIPGLFSKKVSLYSFTNFD